MSQVRCIADVAELERMLSEPSPRLVEAMARLPGDILILGAGGKMGPTLSRMARRAADAAGRPRRIIAVSRFSDGSLVESLRQCGVETISADLLDEQRLAQLPDAPNVVFMAGMKFGSTGRESLTWAMNTYLPALVAQRWRRSRIAVFSTGNVYGLCPASRGGSVETDAPAPVGEYAMSCLGRERMFEHFSRQYGTPVSIIRLNYACEMRYGVLVDLCTKVRDGRPVDLAMGYFNVIWQGDASAMALQTLAHAASPPLVINIAGPELLRTADACRRFGEMLGRQPVLTGTESPDAILSNASLARRLLGDVRVTADRLMEWVADWVKRGGPLLGKPTHFEVRNGKF